jgi:hypothetical protein
VRTHAAAPIRRIIVGTRQQFTGARRFDDIDGTITPKLRALGVERHDEVQPLTGVSIDCGEQCGIGDIEIGLIEGDLRGVLREGFFETVALDCAPVSSVDSFAFPDCGIDQVGARQVGAVNDDTVGVSA